MSIIFETGFVERTALNASSPHKLTVNWFINSSLAHIYFHRTYIINLFMERILISGGAGFIGSHLCDYLLKKGFGVVAVDNFITGSRGNIKHNLENPNFEFLEIDVSKEIAQVDNLGYIFHLASPASPADYQNLSEEIALVNSIGTLNLLKLAQKNKARFLLASTSEVYGDPEVHPQKESYKGNVNSYGFRSCYDESKRFAETLAYIYVHKYDLDIRIVRIFNTYGPRMRKNDGRVVSNFINQALEGSPITVYGDGIQTRSFCFVSDMVEAIYEIMFKEGIKGEIFNLGNPDEYTMIDLAKKIKKMVGSSSEIVFKPLPEDDPTRRCPDISKIKQVLGWEPKVGIEDGLLKTIKFYQSL